MFTNVCIDRDGVPNHFTERWCGYGNYFNIQFILLESSGI